MSKMVETVREFMRKIVISFTMANLAKVTFLSLIIVIICYAVSSHYVEKTNEVLYKELIERSEVLASDKIKDVEVIKCVLLDCKYVKMNNQYYLFINNNFEEVTDANTIIAIDNRNSIKTTVNNNTYYISRQLEKELMDIASDSSYLTGLCSFAIMFVFLVLSFNSRRFVYRVAKDELEDLIQKELTESLHHELNTPLLALESKVEMLMECKDEESKAKLKDGFTTSLEMIRDILKIMANRKHLRYTNGTIPLIRLIENAASFNRIRHMNVGKINIDNKELFESFSLLNLENSVFVNILNNLITNSIEAGSNLINISGELRSEVGKNNVRVETIILYCKDNGSGILDKNKNICNNENIFKYSYSTKDVSDKFKEKNGIFKALKALIGGLEEVKSVRGAGLAISKKLLVSVGDDITLFKTSREGTIFKLTLKVKRRIINEDESRLIEDVKKN